MVIDGDGQAEIVAPGAAGVLAWKCDRVTHQWAQIGPAPGLPESANWGDPKYNFTLRWADVDGDGRKELVMRGPRGLCRAVSIRSAGIIGRSCLAGASIPPSDSGNIANVKDNLMKMDQLADQIHDASQDKIVELQTIAEIETKNLRIRRSCSSSPTASRPPSVSRAQV